MTRQQAWFAVLCAFTALSGLTLSEGVVSHRPLLWIAGGLGSAAVCLVVICRREQS